MEPTPRNRLILVGRDARRVSRRWLIGAARYLNDRHRALQCSVFSVFLGFVLAGCATPPKQDRTAAAKNLFDQTVQQSHLPSAEAKGAERDALLSRAADGYAQLLRVYSDQPYWCAQAQRSLANVRASQGRLDDAIKLYAGVADRWPQNDWEIIQSWKSASDLLAGAGRVVEARAFDQKIVARFDGKDQPQLIQSIVRAAARRLVP